MRAGMTLAEVMVASVLLTTILTALWLAFSTGRSGEKVAAMHLAALENLALAMAQIRLDARQLVIVPGRPVVPYSVRIVDDARPEKRALRLRRGAPLLGEVHGSRYVHLQYHLEPITGKKDRYHLVRSVRTSSGAKLPWRDVASERRIFRAFELTGMKASYTEDDADDVRLLHVELAVALEGVDAARGGPMKDGEITTTVTVHTVRPEPPYGAPSFFAESVFAAAERPSGAVVSAPGLELDELPDGPP